MPDLCTEVTDKQIAFGKAARETKGKIDFSKGNSKTVVTGYWIHLKINEEENNK